ncbi:acyl-CoA dehydrogenase family protein [Citricoccus muralis]|uniref:Acyl-CoA dehydrogenase family protein n=1 Tax=Citricoccus muralis TaxID=169134 RepID=A0ABY8H7Q6_9MICC|nr:acyl-CoA dehydrogenase family protein [Citricoccus muralis]WFP16961.1 acyl-CoA dehydrogenase family protein [Citricoccus muralis]
MFAGFYEELHEEFRELAREFSAREVAPHYADWEKAHRMDRSLWTAAGEQGLLGLAVPEEFGGMGLNDYRFRMVLDEELCRAGHESVGLAFHLHDDWVLPALLRYGNDEQQSRWLPRMVDGSLVTSVAWTEPGCGSDLRGVRTKAVPDGEVWVLDGQKTFIGNGITGDAALVLARTDGSSPTERGGANSFSLFFVEKTAGYDVGSPLEKMGLTASDTAELFFTGVRVPGANLIGELGAGLRYVHELLPQGRLAVATSSVALAAQTLRATREYVSQRQVSDRSVDEFQNTRFRLADMQVSLEVTQHYVAQAVTRFNDGELSLTDASKTKMWASERAKELIDQCLQLHGGYGYILEYPVAKAYLAVRLFTIFGGTSEVLRDTIARDLVS